MAEPRRKRSNGEASQERILDAATEIAGERGYEGTSINLVSKRSGLPASSIYWHFKDKDELIAAVIDRSFTRWVEVLDSPAAGPDDTDLEARLHLTLQRTGSAIARFPDFLRLGLLLILERRPEEPTARAKFLEVRQATADRIRGFYGSYFASLDAAAIESLVTLTLALADGFFVASEVDDIDLADAFDLMATAILGTAHELAHQLAHQPQPSER
jgi:AcrR family transcriptional regulator